MFHSFHIMIDDAVIEAEQLEKVGQELMATRNIARERFTRGRQDKAPIFFVFEQTVGIKPLHHIGHARLGNLEARGDINYARVALGVDQLENAFEVIFYGG